MKLINIHKDKIYQGIDIVSKVIEDNQTLYAKPNVQFYHINDIFSNKPENPILKGDLLIIKDVLMHWPNNKIQYFLEKILPMFKYALITNDYMDENEDHEEINKDIKVGQWRPLDIIALPFNLKNVKLVLKYQNRGGNKKVYLYQNPNLSAIKYKPLRSKVAKVYRIFYEYPIIF